MDPAAIDTEQTITLLREAARAMRSVLTSPADEVRALAKARNAIDARTADLLAEMDQTKAHETEGAASIATWAQRELLQDPTTTRQMVRSAKTMRDLPTFGAAHRAGRLSNAHVNAMTFALNQVGFNETITMEEQWLTVAAQKPPKELFRLVRHCKAIAHSDELDQAWLNGMDKQDVRCLPVPDGFHITGFLPIDVGAKLKTFLDSVAVPHNGEDTRSNAQRRIDGLDELLTTTLGHGLPAQNSVSPHLSVVVDANTLKNTLNGHTGHTGQQELLTTEPAILEGFGPIGPALLSYLAFGGTLTPILVTGFKTNRTILDVGRTERLATKKQRHAIHLRQQGRCANRGCHHPIGEIHHVTDWLYGGHTNLNNLAGLCRKCHALITVGRLTMTGTFDTGYTFTTTRAGPLARTG